MKIRFSFVAFINCFLLLSLPLPRLIGQQYNDATRDSINAHLARANKLSIVAPYRSIQLNKRALSLAEQVEDLDLVAEAQYQICITLNGSIPYDSLQTICETALNHFRKRDNELKTAKIRNYLGIVHDVLGEKEKAIEYFKKAIEQFKSINACRELANTYNNFGVVFLNSKKDEKARGYYFQALKVNQDCQDERNEMISFHNIGAQFLRNNELEVALSYLHRAEKTARNTQDQFWMTTVCLRLASLYFKKGELPKAQGYAEEALAIARANKDSYVIPYCYTRLARIHKANREFAVAIRYYKESVAEQQRNNKKKGLSALYNSLAECHLHLDQYDQAKLFLDSASTFSNRSWANIAKTLGQYAILYEKTEDLTRSIAYHKQYKMARDSLFAHKLKSNIKQLEQNFLLEQQKTDFKDLSERYEVQNWLVQGLFVFSLLLAGFLAAYFQFYQDKKRHNKELESRVRERTASLERSNEELQKFAFIASHDLKSPIRNIYGFLSLIKRRCSQGMDPKEGMQFIDHALVATKKMHTLIEDVLEYSRMEYLDTKSEPVYLGDLIADITTDLEKSEAYPGAKVHIEGSLPVLTGNPVLFKQLFTNLIDNGLKYNESDYQKVTIASTISSERVLLSVSDNGIGIPVEYRNKVFGIFKRLHPSGQFEGTGIGLAICKKIADYYQGELTITDNQPQGTTFQLSLPVQMIARSKPVPDREPVSLPH